MDDVNKIKILFFIESLEYGGKERQLVELIQLLPKQRFVIFLLVKSMTQSPAYETYLPASNIFSLNHDKIGFNQLIKIWRMVNSIKPDIIYTWFLSGFISVTPYKLIKNFKLIDGSIRNTFTPSLINQLTRRLVIYPISDHIVSNSHLGLEKYYAPKRICTVVYNSFNKKRLELIQNREIILRGLGTNNKKIVIMVARMDASKDYTTFIQAGIDIVKRKLDVVFLLVGDGPDRKKLEESIADTYKGSFIFLGHQQDVESYINISDICVLTSYSEGISNSIIEYMFFGKPIIASRVGATSEIINDGVNGILIEPKDHKLLANKLTELLLNQDYSNYLGNNAKIFAYEKFNIDKIRISYTELFEKLITI